jgi:hypothetical protein
MLFLTLKTFLQKKGNKMSNPHDRGWGDPTKSGYAKTNFRKCTAGGITVTVHKLLVPHFTHVLNEMGKHYPLAKKADDYGAVVRPIRGYEDEWERTHDFKYLSIHSWGGAVDLDSTNNPMTTDTKAKHEIVAPVVDPILAPFRGRFLWGGHYKGARKDYMHIEWVGTVRDAEVLARQMHL